MKLLEWLDRHEFLNIRIWEFSGRSMRSAYGMAFVWRAVLRHPIKTFRGLRKYQYLIQSGHTKQEHYTNITSQHWDGGQDAIVGVGFCLKPLLPSCPSGRSNHNCHFFENDLHLRNGRVPESCAACIIRKYGLLALGQGSSFYIMTSAIDILHDLFLPALRNRAYRSGLFFLCRYSFDPFVLPLLMAEMDFALFPFESGDCRDYATWLKADVGIKEDQTIVSQQNQSLMQRMLSSAGENDRPVRSFQKVGNIFHPL